MGSSQSRNPDSVTAKCGSCDLFDQSSHYAWKLGDTNALLIARNFAKELISWTNDKELSKRIYTINKGYLALRLDQLKDKTLIADIRQSFEQARKNCDPKCIIKAYMKSQSFVNLLNKDMARIIKHDIEKGCSQFSCDTLYTAQDGTKQIASILFHHPVFEQYRYKGTSYCGLFEKDIFTHIDVTNGFSAYDPQEQRLDVNDGQKVSIFCRYDIKAADGSCRALNISRISEKPGEEGILLLSYSVFLVKKKEVSELPNNQGRRIEFHFEQYDDGQSTEG